ncbi:hypothetical protein GCM10008019_46400 [Deinococcus soli (ex Cha et al. 2016)]|nr:hypothetical protein GCM10008019_46400 [Deinococcus soli (ex Cha et al. 2016)]
MDAGENELAAGVASKASFGGFLCGSMLTLLIRSTWTGTATGVSQDGEALRLHIWTPGFRITVHIRFPI